MSDIVEKLRSIRRRGEDGAGTLPAKESVKVRPADWHAACDGLTEAAAEIERLRAENARCRQIAQERLDALVELDARLAEAVEALKQIEWSNDSKWQSDCARAFLAKMETASE